MKVLAIGAHPDDIEIFMFGLLCKLKEEKHEIFLSIATDGSKGGENPGKALAKIRKKETVLALEPLGLPIMLNFIDGELSHSNNASQKIISLINKIEPDLVVTHSAEDYHSDHNALSLYIKSATSFRCPIIYCDTLMGVNFKPNIYIDITSYFELKKNAILKHKSQDPQKYFRMAKIMNKYRSAQSNNLKGYCEAYRFEPKFPFVDLRDILPKGPHIKLHQL